MNGRWWRHRRDRGSASLETVVLAPPLLLLIGLAAVGMRVQDAKSAIEAAAYDAARAASISRTTGTAQSRASTAADIALSQGGLRCANLSVSVNTAEFARPVGQPANVYVTVTCDVILADLGVPGLPGTRRLTATFTSPLDLYRGRL